jgi:hypothetical protein
MGILKKIVDKTQVGDSNGIVPAGTRPSATGSL